MKKTIGKYAVHILMLSSIVTLSLPETSSAYYLELTNTSGGLTEGQYYTMDIYFRGDATDNVETFFTAVEWDTSLLTYQGIQYVDYVRDNGTPISFDDYTLWNGEELPDTVVTADGGTEPYLIYNINGAENLSYPDEFYPVASGESLMATIYFIADASGSYSDLASFVYSSWDEVFMVNDTIIDEVNTSIWNDTTSSYFGPSEYAPNSAVPVPAAAWLLGAGLMGLVGLRRRNVA